MEVVMSRQAMGQARERGVFINEIKETLGKGAKYPQNGKIVSLYRYIKIVFKKQNNKALVITVMIRK